MPPALRDRPAYTEEHRFYFDAFFFLSNFRAAGFSGPGALSFTDVLRYAELVGYTREDEIFFFCQVMVSCDQAYRKFHNDTKPSGKPTGGQRQSSPPIKGYRSKRH